MPLRVMINGEDLNSKPFKSNTVGVKSVHFETITVCCEEQLSSALTNGLGIEDLSCYQLVSPHESVTWSTKCVHFKGKQLKLRRQQYPNLNTDNSDYYGCNNTHVVRKNKSYTEKRKLEPDPWLTGGQGQGPDTGGQSHLDVDDVTFVKRTATHPPCTLNIPCHEIALKDTLKSPTAYLSPSTHISNEINSSIAPSTSNLCVTPSTEDSVDNHRSSFPSMLSPLTASINDDFTLDEETGLKVPLSSTKLSQTATSTHNLSHFSTHENSDHELHLPTLNLSDNSTLDNVENIHGVQGGHFKKFCSTPDNAFNDLNSASHCKVYSFPIQNDWNTHENNCRKDYSYQPKGSNLKLTITQGDNETEKRDQAVGLDSSLSSCSIASNSPEVVMNFSGNSGSTHLKMPSPSEQQYLLNGLSPSGYVPFNFALQCCQMLTTENKHPFPQKASLPYGPANFAIGKDNQTSLFVPGQITQLQSSSAQPATLLSKQMPMGDPLSQEEMERVVKHTCNEPNPNFTHQNETMKKQPYPQLNERQSERNIPQNKFTHPKTEESLMAHTPCSSGEYCHQPSPPYSEAIRYYHQLPTYSLKESYPSNTKTMVEERNCQQVHPLSTAQQNYAQIRKSQSQPNSVLPRQRETNQPASILSESVAYTNVVNLPVTHTNGRNLFSIINLSQIQPPTDQVPPMNYAGDKNNQVNRINLPLGNNNTDMYLTVCDPPYDVNNRQFSTKFLANPAPQQVHSNVPKAQSVISENSSSYNYIESSRIAVRSPQVSPTRRNVTPVPPPPRRMTLEEQLSKVDGWSPDESDYTIEKSMEKYRSQDGFYIVWKSELRNRYMICVSHHGALHHFKIEEQRQAESNQVIYFVYVEGFFSDSLLEVINHYKQSGIKKRIMDERFRSGEKQYNNIHIPLKYPLKVKLVVHKHRPLSK